MFPPDRCRIYTEVSYPIGSLRFKMSSSHWIKTQIFTKLMKSDGHYAGTKCTNISIFQFNNLQQLVTPIMNHLRQRNQKSDHPVTVTASNCFLGVWSILKTLGSHFWLRNWKPMWKPYAASIFDFMTNKNLPRIFRTSFNKNWLI